MRNLPLCRLVVAVFGVGDVGSPFRFRLLARTDAFGDGEVGHEVARRGAVPVPFVGGGVDDVTRTYLADLAAAGLHPACSLGDVEGLAEGVGVPGGACAGREAHS